MRNRHHRTTHDKICAPAFRLAADENFNGDIVRGLLRRNPKLDIIRGEWEGQVRFLPL
jgi:hypothetical protein